MHGCLVTRCAPGYLGDALRDGLEDAALVLARDLRVERQDSELTTTCEHMCTSTKPQTKLCVCACAR